MSKPWVRVVLALGNLHRRVLGVVFLLIGPRLAYRLTGWGAQLLYLLLDPLRARSEAQCAVALRGRVAEKDVPRIARQSFVNRSRNLTDLLLASHLLRPGTYERYGGRIPEPFLGQMLDARREGRAVILLTAYFGSFDLFPIFLGYSGIEATTVYLPHSNAGFDGFRRRVRGQSGGELIPVDEAAVRLGEVLGRGGAVAIVADHHIGDGGMQAEFLGVKTTVPRSVGLLAWRYEADVVVAGIRRVDDTFRFEVTVTDVIHRRETAQQEDAVAFVTDRYLRGLERLILHDPAHYLWGYARWGEAHARQVVVERSARDLHDPHDGNNARPVSASAGRVRQGEREVEP